MVKIGAAYGRISRWQIGAYSFAIWPLVVGQMPLGFMTAYYSQIIGLNLAVVGFIMMAGRIFDVGADVLVAYLSDSHPTRFGRRKPWVVVGLSLFIPTLWLLYVPYPSMSLLRYGVATFLFFTTWTMAFIPYLSHGTELSTDHHERSIINLSQSIVMLLGFFVGYILPFLLVDKRTFGLRTLAADRLARVGLPALKPIVDFLHRIPLTGVASYGQTMLVVVIATTIIGPLALAGYVLLAPDRSGKDTHRKGSVIHALKNLVFLRFCAGYLLIMAGYLGRTGVFPFLLAFWFGRPDLLLVLVLSQNVTSILITPAWSFIFKRLERRSCIALAAMIEVCALAFLALIPAGQDNLLILAFVMIGLPGQTLMMASFLIAADCADYANWKNRTESRAVHVSLVSLIVKFGNIAAALSVFVAGAFGFNPRLPAQPVVMIHMLKVVGLYVPMALLLAGAAVVMTFPITRRRQAAIQRRLDRRHDALADADRQAGGAHGERALGLTKGDLLGAPGAPAS